MFKAIKQLLISLGGYDSDWIFQNFPNDVTMPEDNNFIVMNKLYSKPNTALVQKFLAANETDKTVTTTANQLLTTNFQVDFFGDLADEYSTMFATVLQSGFANDYFIANSYPYTVRTSESPLQLTHSMDRENYVYKFAVRFSLFNNSIVNNVIEGADQVTITPTLIETIKP